ncbi:hypothetical protein [Blastococcus sp. SYSU D00820]
MSDPYGGQPGWGPGQQQPGWGQQQQQQPAWGQQQQPSWGGQPQQAWGPQYGATPPAGRSRKGLWWSLGALLLVLVVGAGVTVFLLTREVDPPTGVAAALDGESVVVSWQAVEGATEYDVFRGDEQLGSTAETSYVDTEAPGGTELRYSVVTVEDGDRSTEVETDPVVTPVDPPTGFGAAAAGTDVELAWDEVTGADRYEVSRNGELLADDVTGTSYVDEEVPLGDHEYLLTAVDEDGEGSTSETSLSFFAQGPWQEAYQIGENFSELVGSEPGAPAWNGATCSPSTSGDTAALVTCDYPNGIYVEVLQFTDATQRDANTAAISAGADPGLSGTWSYGDGPAEGDLFVSPPTGLAWRYLTFYGGGLELFAVYAAWEGHSGDELRDAWFVNAPF